MEMEQTARKVPTKEIYYRTRQSYLTTMRKPEISLRLVSMKQSGEFKVDNAFS